MKKSAFTGLLVWLFALVLILQAGCSPAVGAEQTSEPLIVTLPPLGKKDTAHSLYFPKLLDLALRKTQDSQGSFAIRFFPLPLSTGRVLAKLKSGEGINVTWALPDAQYERDLRRLPISLLRGLSSHRVLLIRAGNGERFKDIDSLEELRKLRAGQGQHWVDTQVLRANQLPVVTSANHERLFNMLARKRFDYFPRGLYEIQTELEQYADLNLAIEPGLMLHYPAPMYFYVHPDDESLAQRIEEGLRLAQKDGSFDELFFSMPGFRWGYRQMHNSGRKVLKLDLPADSPCRTSCD